MGLPLLVPLLLLQLLSMASCEICPPPEDIDPCTCGDKAWTQGKIEIVCDGTTLKNIDDAFDKLRGKTIDTVTIKNSKGGRLSSVLFWNTTVRAINIKECDLEGLADTDNRPAFLGLEHSLVSLSVWNSVKQVNQLKTLDLSHLKVLQSLDLYGNNMTEMGDDWFAQGPVSLTHVYIKNCELSQLGDAVFAPLVHLRSLSLNGNSLTTLERSMLPYPAANLRYLDLSYNNFTSLTPDIFSEMPLLEFVHLKDSSIRLIEEKTWSSVWEQLHDVDLDNNPLECDLHMEWMFSLHRPQKILGTCDSPANVQGVQLLYFIEINRRMLALTGKSFVSSSMEELRVDLADDVNINF